MTVVICILGALVGVTVGEICGRLALPMVLRSQAGQPRPQWLGEMTKAIYRFVFPVVFGVVGGLGAYQVFVGDLR